MERLACVQVIDKLLGQVARFAGSGSPSTDWSGV